MVIKVVIHDDQNDRVTAPERGLDIGEKCQEQEQNNYNNEAAAAENLLSPDLGDYRIVYLLHDQSDKVSATKRGQEIGEKCMQGAAGASRSV